MVPTLLVLTILALPLGQAASVTLPDPAGDWKTAHPVGIPGVDGRDPLPTDGPGSDYLGLEIRETQTDLFFGFQLDSLERWNDPSVSKSLGVSFEVDGRRYHLLALGGRAHLQDNATVLGRIQVETADDSIILKVPRLLLLDSQGFAPQGGSVISVVNSAWWVPRDLQGDTNDDLDGTPVPTALVLEESPNSFGALVAGVRSAVRASNGGAETFVFRLVIRNDGDIPATVAASPVDVPPDWTIRVQDSIPVAPGKTVEVPVLVATSSGHTHGTFAGFGIRLVDETSGEQATVFMGVDFVDPPQPAGHHPTLWIHAETRLNGWMDTVADTEAQNPLTAQSANPGHVLFDQSAHWEIPMDPNLMRGLRFKPNEDAVARFTLLGDATDRTLLGGSAFLLACYPPGAGEPLESDQGHWRCIHEWQILAVGDLEPSTIARGASVPMEVRMAPRLLNATLPFIEQSNLMFYIRSEFAEPFPWGAPGAPSDVQGVRLSTQDSSLDLPLLEYQDEIQNAFLETLDLRMAIGPRVLEAPPGIAWFAGTLENLGGSLLEVELSAFGNVPGDPVWKPKRSISIPAGDVQEFAIGVPVPDVADGTAYDFVLEARNPAKEGVAAASLRLVVDHEAAPLDEPSIKGSKPSPSPVAVAIVAFVGLAIARRRLL